MSASAESVVLELEDRVSGAAQAATGALARLEGQIARETAALGRLEASLATTKASLRGIASGDANGVVNVGKYRQASNAITNMGDRIAGQKDKIGNLKDKLDGLGWSAAIAGRSANHAHPPFRAMGQAARTLGGEAGALTAELTHVAHILMRIGPTIAIAIVAFVAATAAIVGFVEIVKHGIEGADELRNETLKLASAGVTLWDSQRASVASGEALMATIEHVSRGSATAREKISEYAVELQNAGLRGKQLESALKTTALVAAGGNEKLAKSFIGVAASTRVVGGDLEKLGERMKKKFGDVAEARLLSLDVQWQKFKETVSAAFSAADVEPFLRGLRAMLGLLGEDGDAFKTLGDFITKTTEKAIGWMLRLELVILKGLLYLKHHQAAWQLVKSAILGVAIGVGILAGAMLLVFATVGVAIGVILLAIGAVGYALFAVGKFFVDNWQTAVDAVTAEWDHAVDQIAYGISYVVWMWDWVKWAAGRAWDWIVAKVSAAIDAIKNFSLFDLGKNMIAGLVNGIMGAGSAVLDALKSVVLGPVKKVEGLLGIGSPSRYMRQEIGYQMGAGLALGHEDAEPLVQESGKAMAAAGVRGASVTNLTNVNATAPSAEKGAPESGGHSIQFTNCQFGENSEAGLRKVILSILEGESFAAAEPI